MTDTNKVEPMGEVRKGEAYFYNGMYTDKTDLPDGTLLYPASALAEAQAEVERLTERCAEYEREKLRALQKALKGKFETLGEHTKVDVEPVAIRHNFDGYGWCFLDNGSGSNWLARGMKYEDAEPLYQASALAALQAQLDEAREERDMHYIRCASLLFSDVLRDTTTGDIRKLAAEYVDAKAELAEWQHTNRIDALYRQLEAAQADAARYRWLRDMDEQPVYSLAAIFTDCQGSAESISLRIDRAVDTLMRMPK